MKSTSVRQTCFGDPAAIEDRILTAPEKQLEMVSEKTIYPAQFPSLLTAKYQGKSVAEVAEILSVPPEHVLRLLAGHWKPTKDIRRRMGLKVVYALKEQP